MLQKNFRSGLRLWAEIKSGKSSKSSERTDNKPFIASHRSLRPPMITCRVLDNTSKALNNTLKQAAGLAGAYLGFKGLVNTFKSIAGVNQEFERLSGSLKTVTGSAKAAKDAFAMIEEFATTTPYQLGEIVDSFIRLKAMGLEPTMEALTSYGNTASAFGKNILEFVGAVTSATVGEFERLKTFGIKAKAEADTVKFIFQGVTTEVAKNASAIERYLRSIGNVNFAGAMDEQMNTMGGTMSNLEDTMAKIARTIGENGLNQAIKGVLKEFDNFMSGTEGAAKAIGETLATAVNMAGKAFMVFGQYVDEIITLLTVRLSAVAVSKTFALIRAGAYAMNTALLGTGAAGASATLGLRMMWQVSKVAAVQMYATAAATKVLNASLSLLKGALGLIGGPAGLALLTGISIYRLVDSHDVAKKAAEDHAETLQKLKDEMAATVQETDNLNDSMSKNQAIADWSYKLKTAEQNVRDLEKELKKTGGVSIWKRNAPDFMLEEYEVFANDLAEILSESKYNLEEYEREIWKLAAEYPDFKPQADAIQEKFLLLKAAYQDMWTAQRELKYLENPELRPKEDIEEQTPEAPSVDTSAYEKNIEDIKKKVFELQEPYDQAIQKAAEWRDNALKNLDSTKSGYDDFKEDVNRVYDDMIKKANEVALKSSTDWRDGLTRGMQSSYSEVSDMAKATESIIKDSFGAMEDTLTEFVTTGKFQFSDFVNSVVEGMVQMAIQYAVIKPIMGGIMGYFGIPMAHTGGVIGADSLSSKAVSLDVFANAPRYHTGGLVGNEIPIIAQRGETVFTKGQMEALGTELNSKPAVNVRINVHNNASGTKATATSNRDSNGDLSIDVMIEQIEGAIGKNISKGEGLSPILEQRYALNPAFGSYR